MSTIKTRPDHLRRPVQYPIRTQTLFPQAHDSYLPWSEGGVRPSRSRSFVARLLTEWCASEIALLRLLHSDGRCGNRAYSDLLWKLTTKIGALHVYSLHFFYFNLEIGMFAEIDSPFCEMHANDEDPRGKHKVENTGLQTRLTCYIYRSVTE